MLKDWNYVFDLAHRRGRANESLAIKDASVLANRKHLHSHGPLLYQDYVYALVRIIKPELVVETGVRYGVCTTHVLKAMEDNNAGHLVSCDPMHPTQVFAMDEIHALCKTPRSLFARWRFFGKASDAEAVPGGRLFAADHAPVTGTILHRMVGEGVDIFIHDSDHSLDYMTWELETALPHVRSGGLIICDDWDWREHSELHRHKDGNVVEKFTKKHGLEFHTIGTAAVMEI
ncbi:MAG: class I SAM-dependent methyltransferase [bacterium]